MVDTVSGAFCRQGVLEYVYDVRGMIPHLKLSLYEYDIYFSFIEHLGCRYHVDSPSLDKMIISHGRVSGDNPYDTNLDNSPSAIRTRVKRAIHSGAAKCYPAYGPIVNSVTFGMLGNQVLNRALVSLVCVISHATRKAVVTAADNLVLSTDDNA